MSPRASSATKIERSREAIQERSTPSAPVPRRLASVSSGPPPRAHSPARRWEIATIVGLTILVHGGIAYGAHLEGTKPRTAKRMTKVEVDLTRPPPPKPALSPPEPAKPPPPPPKPIKAAPPPQPMAAAPKPEKPQPPPPPVDTGSSLPSDADGELYKGSGGLGTVQPPPEPPKPVVAPAPPPPPPPVIQAKEGANYLKNPRPSYPRAAQREGWEGTTILKVQVSPLGKPGSIQIQTSSGRNVLDAAAIDAVKGWTFAPATQGGRPIAGWVTVPIVFKLQ